MNIKEFLNNVCNEIKYKPARKFISEELETHITEIKGENIEKGLNEEVAEENAIEQMGNPIQIGKRLNKIHKPKLEWKLLLLILILIGFRVILYIGNYLEYQGNYSDFVIWELKNNIKYMILSFLLALVIYFFDYRKIKKYSNIMYLLATGILIFQWFNWYFNIDTTTTDGIFNMRLWNLSVPLYIIAFCGYMATYKKEDLAHMIILYTISCVLIYAQSGSITNTLILIFSYLAIIAFQMVKNNKKNVILVCGGIICMAVIVMVLMTNIRGNLLFWGTTTEELYNRYVYEKTQNYEEEILSNLKWIGRADALEELSDSNSSQFKFLYLLGTLGIIPAMALILAIIYISIRLIKNLKNIKDVYGKYLIIGLGTTYIAQSVIHVLMNLNLWIRSDVNLPFVAEGNLYLLINCFTFAIILSVYRRKDINFEEPKKSKWAKKVENIFFEEC